MSSTIEEYIQDAPEEGQAHLRQLLAILTGVAPDAEQVMKWNTPFFIEPRFLFAFSAHKAHLNFTPNAGALEVFRDELQDFKTTQGSLQIPYRDPIPEDLIRRMAEHRVQTVAAREDSGFW
ncbi:MAG: iron chaperone [Verrucomicrobiaceae bacterium]